MICTRKGYLKQVESQMDNTVGGRDRNRDTDIEIGKDGKIKSQETALLSLDISFTVIFKLKEKALGG